MYNLLEYSDNYSITSGSLWNYNRNETSGVDDNASQSKSFEYNTRKTPERLPQPPQPPPDPDGTQHYDPHDHHGHKCQSQT